MSAWLIRFVACMTGPLSAVEGWPVVCACECSDRSRVTIVVQTERLTQPTGLPNLNVTGACWDVDRDRDGDVDLADWSKQLK